MGCFLRSPSWQTHYQHYHGWQHTGTWQSLMSVLLTDLSERGGLDLLTAIEKREISIQRDCQRQLDITYPPHLKNTWQLPTATLLIHLLFSEL